MGPPTDRELLIALNAALDLPRDVVCRLAAARPLWRTPAARDRRAEIAARLGIAGEHLALALELAGGGRALAARELARASEVGVGIVTLDDPSYPERLRDLALPPPVLYRRGRLPARPGVGIVGSRNADAYGREVAELFARDLAAAGLAVVSGFARGVDSAAHEGALAAPAGTTVAVLGCGVDVDYPRGQSRLARRITERGAVISEFPMGAAPLARNFPIRNRLIAALSESVLIVQAARRSGSLITARLALDLGRDVHAVPGRIFEPRARGTNELIRDGATPALAPAQLLETLPIAVQEALEAAPPSPAEPRADWLPGLAVGEPQTAEEIAHRGGLALDAVLARLLELELSGWVRRLPGGLYGRGPRMESP